MMACRSLAGDAGRANLVVEHGSEVNTTGIVGQRERRIISLRSARHAVPTYSPSTALLKIGGDAMARRAEVAEIFARTLLRRPRFFAAEDAQNLYTLQPVERVGYAYRINSDCDRTIQRLEFVEAQMIVWSSTAGPVRCGSITP